MTEPPGEPPVLAHDWFPRPVPRNVRAGERSWLYSAMAFMRYHSRRPCGVFVGRETGVYKGTYFDLGPDGEVRIGDYCTLVGVVISTNRLVRIGDYSFLSHQVVLADDFAATPHGAAAAPGRPARPGREGIVIGQNAWVGARAVLLGGARLGAGAIVGAAAVVDFDVPAYAVVAGNPARVVGWAGGATAGPGGGEGGRG